jgi:hypothetical protein
MANCIDMVGTGCKDTLVICNSTFIALVSLQPVPSLKLTQVAKNQFGFATAILWH